MCDLAPCLKKVTQVFPQTGSILFSWAVLLFYYMVHSCRSEVICMVNTCRDFYAEGFGCGECVACGGGHQSPLWSLSNWRTEGRWEHLCTVLRNDATGGNNNVTSFSTCLLSMHAAQLCSAFITTFKYTLPCVHGGLQNLSSVYKAVSNKSSWLMDIQSMCPRMMSI